MEKKDFVYYDNTYGVLKKLKHDVVLTERIVETILQIFFLFYYAYFINEKAGLSDPEDNEVIKPSLSKEELKQRKNVEDIANKYLEDERLSREEKRKERILHQREKLEQETSRFKEGLKRINIFRKN